MKIGGPWFNKKKRGQPKEWYLSYFVPKKHADGTVVLVDGRTVLERHRPYYESRALAEADKPAILAQYASTGVTTAGGILTRENASEFEQAKRIAPEATLAEIANFWRLHHPLHAARKLTEFVPAFLKDIEVRLGKTRHHEDLESRLRLLGTAFGDRIPATITRAEALAYLKGLGKKGRTVLNQKRAACNFFNYLLQPEVGAIVINPFGGIKRRQLPKVETNEIHFLNVSQVERYLRAAERYDPDLIAHEIVQLIAGVRADDEMADFAGEWVMPQTREVVIPSSAAKTGQREVIAGLEDNFWDWWSEYGRAGVLRPRNYELRWYRIRVLATIYDRNRADELAVLPVKTLLRCSEAAAALKRWPWNARRRTFATHHVAKHQSADRTALIMRHRGDTYTLHNSYRGTGVTPAQGEAYFSLKPRRIRKPICPAAPPPRGIIRLQLERRLERKPIAPAV